MCSSGQSAVLAYHSSTGDAPSTSASKQVPSASASRRLSREMKSNRKDHLR